MNRIRINDLEFNHLQNIRFHFYRFCEPSRSLRQWLRLNLHEECRT